MYTYKPGCMVYGEGLWHEAVVDFVHIADIILFRVGTA